jgi:phage tail-like protein
MTSISPIIPGVPWAFVVVVDDRRSLGRFDRCNGLAIDVAVAEYKEGGNNGYVTRLPRGLMHSTVQLSRLFAQGQSDELRSWVQDVATGKEKRTSVAIHALYQGSPFAKWTLREALPTSWWGPPFDVSTAGATREGVDIVYHGFDEGA